MDSKEKEILKFANQLIKPLSQYGDKRRGYDFSKAKTAKKKAEIIKIWIGEIIYEAIRYKDPKTLKSLIEMIGLEIEDLIKK